MYEKKCPLCGRYSYSASDHCDWKCPYCGENLSLVPGKPAGGGRPAARGLEDSIKKTFSH